MRECAHIAIRALKTHTHTHTHARKKLAEELAGTPELSSWPVILCSYALNCIAKLAKKLAEELAGTEKLAGHFVQLCFELHCETGQAGWKAFR